MKKFADLNLAIAAKNNKTPWNGTISPEDWLEVA